MLRFKTLIHSLLLVAALTFSGSAFAGFSWGSDSCEPGNGTFSQAIAEKAAVEVGAIPVGKSNVKVMLNSPQDVDIQLVDVASGTKIVHWPNGLLKGATASCTTFEAVEYCYSGFNGDGSGKGNEYIHINGTTNKELQMLAFGYNAGDAQVDYSWEAPTDCVDSGSGEFEQELEKGALAEVGVIPAGKENVEVKLEAATDLDIELYHGDKVLVAWKCNTKPDFAENCINSGGLASMEYEGMTIEYSGFNGDGSGKGNEFIKIAGELTKDLTLKAYAFQEGTAKVTYSWGAAVDAPAVDPASYCGENMGFDSGTNMCIIQPEFTAAKDQCDSDLTAANTAKSSCESAKQSCDSDLAAANTAKSSCESAKQSCDSNLAAANTAKASCESTLTVAQGEKTDAMSDLATCQFDLTAAQATAATGNTVLDSKTHWLSSNSSFELLKAGHDCTSSDSKIGVVNTVAECAALCEETSGCEVFIVEHTSGTPAKCWAESATKANCSWKSGAWDAYGLVPATTYTSTLLSECSSDQFESKASTLTSDRECSTTTQCTSSQYELAVPTAKSDRVCQDQPTCAEGQIVTVPGTPVSAQVCADPCPAGEYKDVAADACVAVTACTDEEAETKAPTAISDRECGPKPDVVVWTYQQGAQNSTTGQFMSTMVNPDGGTIPCQYQMSWGYWMMYCNEGLQGRVAFKNLPSNINMLYVGMPKNNITEIVEVQGPAAHTSHIESFYIDTRHSAIGKMNPNIEVKCPEGTTQSNGNGVWGLRTENGNIQCTYP